MHKTPTSTQGLNRYSYILNNPLLTSDPNGEFAPLLAAIAYGAIMGATISTVTYALTSGFNMTWKGAGNAFAMGAIGGALGGGMGHLGTSFLGSFGNSLGYNMMSNIASSSVTSAIFGSKLTWGSVVGSVAGAALGGMMGNSFGKYSASGLANTAKEMFASSIKGMFTGYVNGFAQAAIDGNTNAPLQSMIGGAAGGFSSGLVLNLVLGSPVYVDLKQLSNDLINEGYEDLASVFENPYNKPIFRSGGLYEYANTYQVVGANVHCPDINSVLKNGVFRYKDKDGKLHFPTVIAHELYHIFQQNRDGYASFYYKIFFNEQLKHWFGGPYPYHVPGNLEWEADQYRYKK